MYPDGAAVHHAVDGGHSSISPLTASVTSYSAVTPVHTSTSSARQLVTPLSVSRSSLLPSHLVTTSGAGTCRWTQLQQQQHQQPAYSVLDDNIADFSLMTSLVSTSNCDDVLLKGP